MFPYVTSPGKKPTETFLSQVKSQGASSVASHILAVSWRLPCQKKTPIPGLNKRQMEAILPTGWSPKDYQFPQSSDFKKEDWGAGAQPIPGLLMTRPLPPLTRHRPSFLDLPHGQGLFREYGIAMHLDSTSVAGNLQPEA